MEVVHPRGGEPVALRPCPSWCIVDRHFADLDVVDTDDGYHHYGAEIEVLTSDRFLGAMKGPATVVRAVLKSWTHPLDAEPGPTRVELNLGTAAERTDMCAEITPAEARAVAQALLGLAAIAEPSETGQRPVTRTREALDARHHHRLPAPAARRLPGPVA